MAVRATTEHQRFVAELLALEPGTENSGIAGDKPGYHNSRENLIAEGLTNDYSIRSAVDKLGAGWAGAANDWTFHDAQRGDYSTIMKYMVRIRDAFNRRDPRLTGWREVLGQADPDATAEGYDFVGWYTRTPDDSHLWHIHFSIQRAYTQEWSTFAAMLSILRGEPLELWLHGMVAGMITNLDDLAKVVTTGALVSRPLNEKSTDATERDLFFHLVKMGNTAAGIRAALDRVPTAVVEALKPVIAAEVARALGQLDYARLAAEVATHLQAPTVGPLVLSVSGTLSGTASPS